MDIRLAEEKDLPQIYKLGFDSYSEKIVEQYNGKVNKDKCRKLAETLVKNKSVFVGVIEGGIAGAMLGTIVESGFDSEVIYNSMFFFLKPEYRKFSKQFINDVAEILKFTAATRFVIGMPAFNGGEKMERFLSIMGFKKLESHFIREVNHAGQC